MNIFQGLFFLIFGIGLIAIDFQSLSRGFLPCGSNGLKGRLEFRKQDQPWAYWSMFVVYLVAGVSLTLFAMGLLLGIAQPLPLS